MTAAKDYCIKPIALVRVADSPSAGSRVRFLLRLSAAKIAEMFMEAGVEREPKKSELFSELEKYFCVLPLQGKELVYRLIVENINSKQQNNFHLGRPSWSHETWFISWFIFHSHSKTLELSEFIGPGGGRDIFKSILESPSSFQHIRKVALGSCELNDQRSSFLFEVTECKWKPELREFLNQLANITHLVLRYFCDDDTLALVGRRCKQLQYLKISLSPGSILQQQVTDDGFDELIGYQSSNPTLQELDIKDCFSRSVSARTILALSPITSLRSLHLRSFQFSFLKFCLRRRAAQPAHSLHHLSLAFSSGRVEGFEDFQQDSVDGSNQEELVADILNNIPQMFPALMSLEIEGITGDLLNLECAKVLSLITALRIRKCPRILEMGCFMSNLKVLELDYVPFSTCGPCLKPKFQTVKTLKINKDCYRHSVDIKDLEVLLTACINLQELFVSKVSLQKTVSGKPEYIGEDDFLNLFQSAPHLHNLTIISLEFSGKSPLTERSVNFFVENCPCLRKLENLVTWDLEKESICADKLRDEHGLGVIYASRYHWSLHWKGEDGAFYDSELPVDRF